MNAQVDDREAEAAVGQSLERLIERRDLHALEPSNLEKAKDVRLFSPVDLDHQRSALKPVSHLAYEKWQAWCQRRTLYTVHDILRILHMVPTCGSCNDVHTERTLVSQ